MMEKSNGVAAAASRSIGEGDTVNVGPTYVVHAPTDYEYQEMNDLCNSIMDMPDDVVGSVIVVREGVVVTKISD